MRYLYAGSHRTEGTRQFVRPDELELEFAREMMLPLLLRAVATPCAAERPGRRGASQVHVSELASVAYTIAEIETTEFGSQNQS